MTEPPLPEESIFAQALEITSAAERAAFLDRACGHDQALRTEVEALLRAQERSGDLLDLPENVPATTEPASLAKAAERSSARTSCSSRSAKAAWAPSGWPSRPTRSSAGWRSRSSRRAWTPGRSWHGLKPNGRRWP